MSGILYDMRINAHIFKVCGSIGIHGFFACLFFKKGSVTCSAETTHLNVANAIGYISMNSILFRILVFGLTTKGGVQQFHCIVNVKQHKFLVAQIHNLIKEQEKFPKPRS